MSLLSTSAVLQRARPQLPTELLVCLFHNSTPRLGSKRFPPSSPKPSHTRLANDPTSKSSGGGSFNRRPRSRSQTITLPPKAEFIRDDMPHTGKTSVELEYTKIVQRKRADPEGGDHVRYRRKFNNSMPPRERPLAPALRLSSGTNKDRNPRRRDREERPVTPYFEPNTKSVPTGDLPSEFTSPPLMEGLLTSVIDVLGPNAKPTPIQALMMKHLIKTGEDGQSSSTTWSQHLLASETGSGKSIAYLLPVLQDLKQSELKRKESGEEDEKPRSKTVTNPRALILAPTHELSRQLSTFAKSLIHQIRLRVLCSSRANLPSTAKRNVTASKMAATYAEPEDASGEFEVSRGSRGVRPVDVLVGTPTKILELVRGHGWNWEANKQQNVEDTWDVDENGKAIKPRPFIVGPPEVGLENVEWVVIDEADVLISPDFQEYTRLLLSDIAAARGKPVVYSPELVLPSNDATVRAKQVIPEAPQYPFNLLLTTATIPPYLVSYLDTYHPDLTRLASPNLHKLPSSLKLEYESWTGGRKNKDVERRLRRVWWEDAVASGKINSNTDPEEATSNPQDIPKSKVLIFCNKSTKVEELGEYLEEQGIANIALTSTGDARHRGNNHHLDGFLKVSEDVVPEKTTEGDAKVPHVLITTSLLSRGLDFSPSIKHVFIVDTPLNMVDFLHRAGRSGRAGERGKVIIFEKAKGRGAGKDRDVRKNVGALTA